jgi:tetratricopeptide (TPR) repeat protein
VVFEPALVGSWTWGVEINSDGKNGCEVVLDTTNTMHLVKLGGILLADLGWPDDKGVPFHMFLKIRLEADQIHVAFPSEWLAEQVRTRGLPRHEVLAAGGDPGHVLLTASSEELRRDLLPYLNDPRAWGEVFDLQREAPERNAERLNERSRDVVRTRYGKPEAYSNALAQAEEAVRLVPGDPNYWNTLGAAQYRAGRFVEALGAMARAELLRKAADPEDLALRAMIHHQLGETAEGKKLLGELRKMFDDHRYCGDSDALSLFREAGKLIAPTAK